MGYQVMLISDDPDWCESIRPLAEMENLALEFIRTGSMALKIIMEKRPDLGILDLAIPDIDGLSWLKMARQTEPGKELPVIVVNRAKTDAQLADAFQWGADDFILKDCDPREFSARIRAVLRRRFERQDALGGPMSVGSIVIDPSRHECWVRGKRVLLRPREFELLEILVRKAGRVLPRIYLLETIWGMSRLADTRAVDVGISRLRKALGRRAGNLIETVERLGYLLRVPETPAASPPAA